MMRKALFALAAMVLIAVPANALPPPDFGATAQSEELALNPVAVSATADDLFVDLNRASPADRPALAYEATLFFETSDGMPSTAIGTFDPFDPGRLYIA